MKLRITEQEMYPVYVPSEAPNGWHEVDDERAADWIRVMDEFDRVQREMSDFIATGK